MDELKEIIAEALNANYCRCEGAMSEHDMTKEEWLEEEKFMKEIATATGLNPYYPFAPLTK